MEKNVPFDRLKIIPIRGKVILIFHQLSGYIYNQKQLEDREDLDDKSAGELALSFSAMSTFLS